MVTKLVPDLKLSLFPSPAAGVYFLCPLFFCLLFLSQFARRYLTHLALGHLNLPLSCFQPESFDFLSLTCSLVLSRRCLWHAKALA